VRWVGQMRHGTGKATIMHERRGPALEEYAGTDLHPGTLNIVLDRPFDWSGAETIAVPDAVSWADLDGEWFVSSASVQPISVGDMDAWAVRMERSRAPRNLIEVVAPVRLRDKLSGTVKVALR
jgi:CTP-dependent riboflavin kinase